MNQRIAIIENGLVANIAVYPDDFNPDGVKTVLAPPDVGKGWTFDGTFNPPPPPDFAAIDADTVDRLLLESGVMRAIALMLFEISKAGKTGNWSFFDDVTNKATFKTLLMSLIR